MEELYINDILVELPQKTISQTFQVNDLAETKDRQANYSNNIKIPKTPKNIQTFNLLGITGSTTTLPYEKVAVKYVVDGVELISSGTGQIKNTNKFFNLIIYDGNISMTELLGKTALKSLDFTAHNHSLTEASFVASLSKTSGYIYAPAQYYERASVQVFSIDVMTPLFYVHTLFEMIFTAGGYTIIGDIFTDADYLSRVISMNNGYLRTKTETLSLKTTETNLENIDHSFTFSGQPDPQAYILDSYTAAQTISHRIAFIGSIDVSLGTDYSIVIYVDGILRDTIPFEDNTYFNIERDVSLTAGQKIETGIVITPHLALDVGDPSKVVFVAGYSRTVYTNTISIPITIEDLIGNDLQIDFVKDVMQHYGLSFRKTRFANEFEFKKIQDIVTDKTGADDWSDKFTGVLDNNYKPNYAKINYAKYLHDDNNTNISQTFGDGELTISNDHLAETKTMFTSMFKASSLVSQSHYGMKHWTLKEDNEVESLVSNNDGLRIFKVVITTDSLQYKYKYEDSANFFSHSGDVPVLQFATYQTNIDDNYNELQSVLNEYNETTLSLNLSILDIYNLDFFKLKYFSQLGAYYYLNKVVNYKKGRNTKVQLIKIGADIVPPVSGAAAYSGSSVYSATLTKPGAGEMDAGYEGSSIYAATLRFDVITSAEISKFAQDPLDVCSDTVLITRYHNGVDADPKVNDTIYTDAGGTIALNGGDDYWKLSTGYRLQINSSGLVIFKSVCI